jgi:catechol 2,3-dioxygenase-like lactoylglutathione lyase family enzyme
MSLEHTMTAILPCNDLDACESFYALLGFSKRGDHGDYRILRDGSGTSLHLNKAPEGWLIPGRNPCGLYLHTENVAELAARMGDRLIHPPEDRPRGMFEFAVSDPDETLVRVGRLRVDRASS